MSDHASSPPTLVVGSSPRIRHISVTAAREPLLLATERNEGGGGGGSTTPKLRHQQRAAMAFVTKHYKDDQLLPSPIRGGGVGGGSNEFHEISYDIDNSNYAINQSHSLNDDGYNIPNSGDVSPFMRSPHFGPFIGALSSSPILHLHDGADGAANPTHSYRLYPQRWWIIALFCLLAFNQSRKKGNTKKSKRGVATSKMSNLVSTHAD